MKKEMLITSLIEKGWFYQEDYFDQNFCLGLFSEAKKIQWSKSKIGNNHNKQLDPAIRNDSISWIDDKSASPIQENYLLQMNDLMNVLNQELYLGLKEYECHFAQYQPLGFYKKHLDQLRGSDARVISCILYLNETKKGGELVIYKREDPDAIETIIKPKIGSFVCFLSNQIYHEVLPTENERLSLTGWFRNSIQ